MDYTYLFGNRKTSIGVIGASKGFGYTLLAQIRDIGNIDLRFASSRHPEAVVEVLRELEYTQDIVVCSTEEDVAKAGPDAVIVSSNNDLALSCGLKSIVESSGNTRIGCELSVKALEKGINVYMVSKETDSFAGPYLNQLASRNKAVYCLVNGDQPRNLVDLISWAKALGLEIVAAGKSSEYDLIWDQYSHIFRYEENGHFEKRIDALQDCWRYEGPETLKARAKLIGEFAQPICANFCEMNLVSNVTGLLPAETTVQCPIAKPSELPEIFVPVEDGGILKTTGVLDVFFDLREPDEASFAGGEFVIVKIHNRKVWELLREKGHVVSKSGKYGCLYEPFHIMGVESPITILLGDLLGIGCRPDCRQNSVLSGIAVQDLKAGMTFEVYGHHHDVTGLKAGFHARRPGMLIAPFYLLNGRTLKRDVRKGDVITLDDVDLSGSIEYDLYMKGLAL